MPVTLSPEVRADLDRLIAQHGSVDEVAAFLWDDNYRLRRARNRETALPEENERLKSQILILQGDLQRKGPGLKDGEIVLSVDDAKTWKEFQELKVKPADLKKQLEDGGKAVTELADVRDRDREAEVAAVAGFKPLVLRTLTKDKSLFVELREVDVTTDGKTEKKKVPYVRKVSDAATAGEPLVPYAERELKDYLSALKAEDAEEEEEEGATGTRFPEQIPASGKASGKPDPVKDYVDQKYGGKKKTGSA